MSDDNSVEQAAELEALKSRANALNVQFHPNIKAEKLNEKIQAKLNETPNAPPVASVEAEATVKATVPATAPVIPAAELPTNTASEPEPPVAPPAPPVIEPPVVDAEPVSLTPAQVQEQKQLNARARALELVRVRVTNMDPSKKEYEGELFCAGNALIGTVKKMVPYETDWHVPRIILNMIKARKYQSFTTRTAPNGGKIKESKLVRTFAVEELPPLTAKELGQLSQRQAMAAGTSE